MISPYEQRVLTWLQHQLLEHDPHIGQGNKKIVVDQLKLEQDNAGDNRIMILFRELQRPQCIFGFRALAREPGQPVLQTADGNLEKIDDPEGWASVIFANLIERIGAVDLGLPENCDPNNIT